MWILIRGRFRHGLQTFILLLPVLISLDTAANGVLRNGISARSQSLAGSDLALGHDPLSAMTTNPADITTLESNSLTFSLTTGILDAEYRNPLSTDEADSFYSIIPDIAYARSLDHGLTVGLSVSQLSALEVDWRFQDPPSEGTGITFGEQIHKSSFLVSRAAVGIGYDITTELSVGASLGLLYNRNRLKAPYIFQSAPGLAGVKVLANLEADGFGWNGVLSINYKPTDRLELLLAYTMPSEFDTSGTIRGLAPLGIGNYSYDVEVETELPQIVSAGFNYRFNQPLQIGLQLDGSTGVMLSGNCHCISPTGQMVCYRHASTTSHPLTGKTSLSFGSVRNTGGRINWMFVPVTALVTARSLRRH